MTVGRVGYVIAEWVGTVEGVIRSGCLAGEEEVNTPLTL